MKTLAEMFQEEEHQLERFATRLEEFRKHTKHYEHLLAELDMLDHFGTGVCVASNTFDIRFTGPKQHLIEVFKVLRREGYNSEVKAKEGEPSYSAFWTHKNRPSIWVSFSSKSCRRVKIGTKMVEQDVYETVCDEVEPYAAG